MTKTLDSLTIGEAKQLAALFGNQQAAKSDGIAFNLGQKVIVRTYAAGVWFGTLSQKAGKEVILTDARRMWQWHAAKSISLSGVAVHGIVQSKSRIAPEVESVWLEAIEILTLTQEAIKSIEGAEDAKAA